MTKVKLRSNLKIVIPQTAKDIVIFLFMSKEKNLSLMVRESWINCPTIQFYY